MKANDATAERLTESRRPNLIIRIARQLALVVAGFALGAIIPGVMAQIAVTALPGFFGPPPGLERGPWGDELLGSIQIRMSVVELIATAIPLILIVKLPKGWKALGIAALPLPLYLFLSYFFLGAF